MRDSAHGQQGGFALWIRTGRWPDPDASVAVERKFNPWHDPEDGRFTFAGQGRHYGSGGRGSSTATAPRKRGRFKPGNGSYGGAGGSGSFGDSSPARFVPRPVPRKPSTPLRVIPGPAPFRPRPSVRPAPARPIRTPRWRKVVRNGYVFQLDELDNTRRIDGTLTDEAKTPRSRAAQRNAGKPDRLPTDDGGHFIANRFNGPSDAFNHFAQDASANRGAYRVLEQEWADALAQRKTVKVTIIPNYPEGSRRPSQLKIFYSIDGVRHQRTIDNSYKPKAKDQIRGKS